jgi:hypothetical protein
MCSLARESSVYAEHLREMAADLRRESHHLRANLDRLFAQRRLARGVDPPIPRPGGA